MSTQENLNWTLQFDLAQGGAGITKATSLLKDLHMQIMQANQETMSFGKNFKGMLNNTRSGGSRGFSGGIGSSATKAGSGISNINSMKSALSGLQSSGIGAASGLSRIASAAGPVAVAVGLAVASVKATYDVIDGYTEKAVKGFSLRTTALRTYSTILGSTEQAQERFNKVSDLGLKTEFTREQLQKVDTRLTVGGFRGEAADKALLTVADLAASAPEEERGGLSNRIAAALTKLNQEGVLKTIRLNQISQAVNVGLVKQEIAKSMGKKVGDVDDLIKNRKVSSSVAMAAIQNATLRHLGTSKLGEFSTGAAGGIGALLSNKEEAMQNLFLNIDPDTLPAYKMYKKSIEGVTESMNASTESGRNMKYVLESVSNLGMGFRAAGNKFMQSFIESFGKSFRWAMGKLGGDADKTADSFEMLSKVFSAVGKVVGYVGAVAGAIVANYENAGNRLQFIYNTGRMAIATVKDVVETISNGFSGIGNGLKNIFTSLAVMWQGAMSLSPSKIKEGAAMMAQTSFSIPGGFVTTNRDRMRGTIAEEASVAKMIRDKERQEDAKKKKIQDAAAGKYSNGESTGGGNGKSSKNSGIPIGFSYSGGVVDMSPYTMPTSTLSVGAGSVPPALSVSPNSFLSTSPVHVENVAIYIQGSSSSPTEIANEIYTKLSQQVGRLNRSTDSQVM